MLEPRANADRPRWPRLLLLLLRPPSLLLPVLLQVPERRYWNLVVTALGKIGDTTALEKFSQSAKVPPIGFRPFAIACIEGGKPQYAARYISRVKDDNQQIDLYLTIRHYKEAVETALRRRDFYPRLPEILRAAETEGGDPEMRRMLLAMIHKAGVAM